MNNEILPIGAVSPKGRELYAYLSSHILQKGRQPTLYSMALFMRTDCDAVMGMLSSLQRFKLITYSTDGGLRVSFPVRSAWMRYGGEVG